MRRFVKFATTAIVLFAIAGLACAGVAYIRADSLVAKLPSRERALAVSDLSAEQRRILIAVEDPAFDEHHGVDLKTPGAGLTTITQGLVKFIYFDRFKPGLAKIPQTLFAFGFDAATPKDEQLRLYLNHTYLGTIKGNPVRGFEEGARTYFGLSFRDLSREQFIALVATTIAPDRLNPSRDAAANAVRVARIERLLAGRCKPRGLRDVTYEDCAQSRGM